VQKTTPKTSSDLKGTWDFTNGFCACKERERLDTLQTKVLSALVTSSPLQGRRIEDSGKRCTESICYMV